MSMTEILAPSLNTEDSWAVLVVDDDKLVHEMLRINLRELECEGRGIHFLHANSAAEAQHVMKTHDDIAAVILDVMMERDDAGLSFVKWIREETKNQNVRILLHTGQPGVAPKKEVSDEYDIDAYLDKNVADNDDCYVALKLALRAYNNRRQLQQAAAKEDSYLLEQIARIYIELLEEISERDEYTEVVRKINAMVHLSQELLAGYALNDMKIGAAAGSTKAERLSYRDYSALTQIHDMKIILMQTTLQQFKIESVGIGQALRRAAKNFSEIHILSKATAKNLADTVTRYAVVETGHE